jgi:putative transposase
VKPETVINWHRKGFKLFWAYKSRKKGPGRPVDLFKVPTANFQVLSVLVIIRHDTRQVVQFNITRHPTGMWAAQQIVEACPWDALPKYLLRDRDSIYSEYFQSRIQNMGINEVKTAPKSPWQNPLYETLIGSIRRDCINAMIILNEDHLRHILTEYLAYYHEDRTHLGLGKEPPAGRLVSKKHGNAKVVALPRLGGLHHRYEWQDAA